MSDTADISAQAAEWIVRLDTPDPDEQVRTQAAFEAWRRIDPRHAAAADRLQHVVGRLRAFGTDTRGAASARAALRAGIATARGRRVGAVFSLALTVLLPLLIAMLSGQPVGLGMLQADLRTAVGEWQTLTLDDGSRVTLSSGSAVALRHDGAERRMQLLQGSLHIEVAPDAGRPFIVETWQAQIVALGTRFTLTVSDAATELTMLESRTAVTSRAVAGAPLIVQAGQRVRIGADGVSAPMAIDAAGIEDDWHLRRWTVHDRPLGEVLDVLGAHRRGWLIYDRAALDALRISAVLPLDDPERALTLLDAGIADLSVRRHARWIVQIERQR